MTSYAPDGPGKAQRGVGRDKLWLGVILAAYAVLALAYSAVNPAFESPDEIHHYAYVDYLLRERRLPVAKLGGPESEYHQPPLYYLLGGLVAAPVRGTIAPYVVAQPNPFWNWYVGQIELGNKNQFIHGPAEAFPYQGWALRLHLVRWLSIALQALTILATYLIGREIFPEQPAIRLGALAFVAFVPQFLFVASSVTNDDLVTPLVALTTWLLVRALKRGISLGLVLGLGVVTGLAVLAKISGVAVLAVVLVVLAVIGLRDRAWQKWAWGWGAVIGLSALLAGPILVRNVRIYGEPTGLQRMSAVWGQHNPPLSYAEALREIPNVWSSFWARFGYGQIPVPNMIYQVLWVVAGLAAAGLILWFVRERRRLAAVTIWQILLLVVVGAAYAFSVVTYVRVSLAGAYGRFAFPALPAYAILMFLGLSGLTPRRWDSILAGVANAGMLLFAVGVLIFYLRPAYAAPPLLKAEQVPATARSGDALVDGTLRLLAYDSLQEAVRPGERLPVTVYWQSVAPTPRDLSAFVHLWGRDMTLVGLTGTYPGLGTIPTSTLKPGDIVRDTYRVPVEISATAPSLLGVQVGFFEYGGGDEVPLPAVDSAGRPSNGFIGKVRLLPQAPPTYEITHPDRFDLDGKALLLGYDLGPATIRAGDAISLTLYWQSQQRMTEDYQVFVHLVGPLPDEQRVAQVDKQPLDGNWPTRAWEPGYPVRDVYALSLPAEARPGTYELRAGLYRLSDGWRMPVQGPEGRVKESAMVLGQVEVQ